jgi:3-hydroxyacyl-CoA dehydrogenase
MSLFIAATKQETLHLRLARVAIASAVMRNAANVRFLSTSNVTQGDKAASGPIQNIAVFGSGLMGAGIVQVAAQSGFNVTMVDLKQDALKKGSESAQDVERTKSAHIVPS